MNIKCLLFLIIPMISCIARYTVPEYDEVPDANLKLIILSTKVGETIDSLERRQYDLFSKAENYESAKVFELDDSIGGYMVELRTIDGKIYHLVNYDPKGIIIMQDMIENKDGYILERDSLMKERKVLYSKDGEPVYEKIKDPFEKKWQIASYDDALGLPITNKEIDMNRYNNFSFSLGFLGCLSAWIIGYRYSIIEHNDLMTGETTYEFHGCALAATITGSISGGLAGLLCGRKLDRKSAINAIKKSRQLVLVE